MATFCDTTGNCYTNLTPAQYVNDTTPDWRVNPLPDNVVFVNGSLTNGTIINGQAYNGTIPNGTIIVERVQPSMIGSLPIVSFIYMIMTFLVILLMASTVVGWIQAAVGGKPYEYTFFLPTSSGALTDKQFNKQIRHHYPKETAEKPTPSYAETSYGLAKGECTAQGLRDFRDLIRQKYALDVNVWNYRFAHETNQPEIDEMKARSEGATSDMVKIVERWMGSREQWSVEEWAQVQEIYLRIRQLHAAEHRRLQGPQ